MGINNKNLNKGTFNEINITPLTDIFLVLLIIMMVIAPLLDNKGLNLIVPQVGPPPDDKKELKYITVDILADGILQIDNKNVSKSMLAHTIKELKVVKKDGLILQAEPDAKHMDVVYVLDMARNVGIENISITEKATQDAEQE